MGNKNGHHSHTTADSTINTRNSISPTLTNIFNELCAGTDSIGRDKIETILGKLLTQKLWKYFSIDGQIINLQTFAKFYETLLDISDEAIIKILQSVEVIINVFITVADVETTESDDKFIDSIVSNMTAKGPDYVSILDWKNSNCPRLFQPIQAKINSLFKVNRPKKVFIPPSDVISSLKMLIVQLSLNPESVYFPQDPSNALKETTWKLLYSSGKHGISTTAFEKHVFDFRGPTVSIFKLSNGVVFALASDEEWRQSSKCFGTIYSALLKLHPTFERVDFTPPPIYCNFKYRSSKLGIHFANSFHVSEDFSDLLAAEVWGCSSQNVLEEQEKQKIRQKMQAERSGKVPLPGKWDVDKSILEMAGHTFSSERRDERPEDYHK